MFWRRKRGYEEFSEEIRAHIDLEAARLVEDGMDPKAARVEALKGFGNVVASRERFYESGRAVWLDHSIQDLRYAVRLILRSPGHAATVVWVMAAAIGAVTAVFSIVNGVLLKPLPYPEPDRLVAYWNGVSPGMSNVLNPDALAALREESRSVEAVSMFALGRQTLNAEGSAFEHQLVRVSAGFFSDVLGVPPALGRDFTPEDERAGAPPAAIISDGLWRNHFGSDPNIIGRVIRPRPGPGPLSGGQYPPLEIIGVLPPHFRSPADLEASDIWTVSGSIASVDVFFQAYGRLRPGVAFEEARAELAAVHERILQAGGERMSDRQIQMTELTALHDARSQGQLILIFFAAVLAVLLVGVANLTGLEMARLPRLESDLSIHAAVGAARGRLVRITMARSILLCLVGGVAGMLLAVAAHDFVLANLPSSFPRQLDVRIEPNVLLFSIGISFVCSLVIASIPAIRASRPNLGALLASADRSTTHGRGRRRFLNLLTVVQCGVTLVLVFAAGLLIHTFWIQTTIDTGFDPDDLMAFSVSFPADYSPVARQNAYQRAVEALSAAPGVEAAAFASSFPMHSVSTGSFRDPAGDSLPPGRAAGGAGNDESVEAEYQRYRYNAVSDAYFESMRIPVIAGRAFSADEARGAAPVAIVSESAARALWPQRGAVGQRIESTSGGSGQVSEFTVVGVAGDIRELNVRQASQPMIYVSMGENFRTFARSGGLDYVVARTPLPPAGVQEILARVDPNAVLRVHVMSDRFALQVERQRLRAVALGGAAAVALAVAMLGVYTVVAYSVTRRTREIGVRMALGAGRRSVFLDALSHALAPPALGLALGLAASFALHRVLGAYLYGIEPSDAGTYAAVVLLMSAVMVAACAVPAFRASRVDPITTLRHE